MPNPIPTLYAVRYKGSGNVQVFPVLGGLTLGPQDGVDVGGAVLETAGTATNTHANRVVEAFGKRFLLHANAIYERNQGGDGNWGQVATLTPMSGDQQHSGLHALVIDGRTIVAALYRDDASTDYYKIWSADGVNWNTALVQADSNNANIGSSIVFGTSIVWWVRSSIRKLLRHDFKTGSTIYYTNDSNNWWGDNVERNTVCVARNTLYTYQHGTNGSASRLVGSSFISLPIVALVGAEAAYPHGIFPWRVTYIPHGAVTSGPFQQNETVQGGTSGATGIITGSGVWANHIYVDSVSGGPFLAGETLTQTTGTNTGANAVIDAGGPEPEELPVYYTVGTDATFGNDRFNWYDRRSATANLNAGGHPGFTQPHGLAAYFRSQGPDPGQDTMYLWFRTGSSFNTAQPFDLYQMDHLGESIGTFIGSTSFTADLYGFVSSFDGGAERVLALGAARPQFGTTATLLTHGAVTNGPFQIGETVSGGTSLASAVVVEVLTGTIKVVNQTDSFINGELLTGGTSGATATTGAVPDEDATYPPREVPGARRRFFRVYGPNTPVSLEFYFSGRDGTNPNGDPNQTGVVPKDRGTILGVGVVAGSPATTPSVVSNQITNLTPDDGATLYYMDADSDGDGLVPGQLHAVMLLPV